MWGRISETMGLVLNCYGFPGCLHTLRLLVRPLGSSICATAGGGGIVTQAIDTLGQVRRIRFVGDF